MDTTPTTIRLGDVGLTYDTPMQMEGRDFLDRLPSRSIYTAVFDPQYRGVLDHLSYGNEGKSRGQRRAALPQMNDSIIWSFMLELDRVLRPSGHLFLWVSKYHLCTGIRRWISATSFNIVDIVTWDKMRIGMGYRTRNAAEYLMVLQKEPRRAKGVWQDHGIPDVWSEQVRRDSPHPHRKPIDLQQRVLAAVTPAGETVIDPAAGSFSVLESAKAAGLRFLGCDIMYEPE